MHNSYKYKRLTLTNFQKHVVYLFRNIKSKMIIMRASSIFEIGKGDFYVLVIVLNKFRSVSMLAILVLVIIKQGRPSSF